jgi:hypothetical protein
MFAEGNLLAHIYTLYGPGQSHHDDRAELGPRRTPLVHAV